MEVVEEGRGVGVEEVREEEEEGEDDVRRGDCLKLNEREGSGNATETEKGRLSLYMREVRREAGTDSACVFVVE